MNPYIALFQFLNTLIDTQITKYVKLATIGIGPDARINACLVVAEVDELLELSDALLNEIAINLAIAPVDNPNFLPIFEQIKFYIEQEHTRAYAGWLLDANNIHTPVMSRVKEQLEQLKGIAQSAGIECSRSAKPVTSIQKQCEHDSYAIAFYILDLVKQIQNDTNSDLSEKIPAHALSIIKKNVATRYEQEEFSNAINQLHTTCQEYLNQSTLEKTSSSLTSDDAQFHQITHLKQLVNIRKRYNQLQPLADMPLSENAAPLAIPYSPTKNNSTMQTRAPTFFKPLLIGAVLVSMLLAYFLGLEHSNVTNNHKP